LCHHIKSAVEPVMSSAQRFCDSVSAVGEMVERVDEQDHTLGVVDRGEAIRRRWLHRVATTVCREPGGRILVHRRPDHVSRFPGQYNWLIGGAVGVGETYPAAASRELAEELGVHAPTRFLFKYLCRGVISPYWLGLHEAVLNEPVVPDASEVAWHAWLTPVELRAAMHDTAFVPDARDAFDRYQAEKAGPRGSLPPHSALPASPERSP
jgi:8-oxo-dGTP pyrophosphatase MutT (NUDIX family)